MKTKISTNHIRTVAALLWLFNFSTFGFAEALTSTDSTVVCLSAKTQFESRSNNLLNRYETDFQQDPVRAANRPKWQHGKNGEIVYLLHGFIGTPFEMSSIARRLNRAGYTTVLDLMPGHALDGRLANDFSITEIRSHVFKNISALLDCGVPVHFVGFSTGSTLIHHYFQSRELTRARLSNAASASLISPFYRPSAAFSGMLSQGLKLLDPAPSVALLYKLTKFPDVRVALIRPQNYMQHLPLHLADEILNLGETVYQAPLRPMAQKSLRVQAFLSEFDLIAAPLASIQKLTIDFTDLKIEKYPFFSKAPHHLMSRDVSAKALELENKIFALIDSLKAQ